MRPENSSLASSSLRSHGKRDVSGLHGADLALTNPLTQQQPRNPFEIILTLELYHQSPALRHILDADIGA